LQACAHRPAELAPTAVAVEIRDTPPAELLACPVRPEGFPLDSMATLPRPLRAAAMRLAQSYAEATDQLERLIGWNTGQPCPTEAPDAQA